MRKSFATLFALAMTAVALIAAAPAASAQNLSCYRYDSNYNKVPSTCTVIASVSTKSITMAFDGVYDHPITVTVQDPQNLIDDVSLTMYNPDGSVADTGYAYRFTQSGVTKTFTYNQRVYESLGDAGRYTVVAELGYGYDPDGYRTDAQALKTTPVPFALLYRSKTYLYAGPEPVQAGANLTLFGRVTLGRDQFGDEYVPGGGGINIYFRRAGAASWTLISTAALGKDGAYARVVRAPYAGTWKAIFTGSADAAQSSAANYVATR